MRATPCLIVLGVLIGSSKLAAQSTPPATVATTATQAAAAAASGSTVATPVQVPITVAVPVIAPRLDPPGNLRLTNLSTRARVTPETPLIAGFALKGATSRTVLVRAAGPALNGFGVSGAVATPRLRLHDASGVVISENFGWSNAAGAAAAIAATGAFPFAAGSADSAVVAALAPGNYSAEVIADGGAGGVALIEIYDVDGIAAGSRLANVSSLGTVAPNGGEVISGFVLAGTGTRQYLVRGVGPGLKQFGVTNVLIDPQETLFDSTGRKMAANDDWSGSGLGAKSGQPGATAVGEMPTAVMNPSQVILASIATGAFPLDPSSPDAAMVVTLAPGAYTVQVRGVSTVVTTVISGVASATPPVTTSGVQTAVSGIPAGATVSLVPPAPGVALLEIYEVP